MQWWAGGKVWSFSPFSKEFCSRQLAGSKHLLGKTSQVPWGGNLYQFMVTKLGLHLSGHTTSLTPGGLSKDSGGHVDQLDSYPLPLDASVPEEEFCTCVVLRLAGSQVFPSRLDWSTVLSRIARKWGRVILFHGWVRSQHLYGLIWVTEGERGSDLHLLGKTSLLP